MLSSEAGEIIGRHRGDALAVVTMTTIFTFPDSDTDDRTIRCAPLMGGASSIGLGLALALPDTKVIVLDGDGSLLMQLGALVTNAQSGVRNLYHFVFHNQVLYEGGGRVPTTGPEVDFPGLAKAAGYAAAHSIEDSADLDAQLPALLDGPAPALIRLQIDVPPSGKWSKENPHGELPDWWFTQMGDDAQRMAAMLSGMSSSR